MVSVVGSAGEPPGPTFEGIPEPTSPPIVVLAPSMQGAPDLSARQRLFFYSDVQWEEFTVEWVRALSHPYVYVTRMGGAGDRGADVAACLSPQGTSGEWHCFQCKHYVNPLRPTDAWPEMVKIFLAKVRQDYELPTRYVFVAPKIGPVLVRHLANPTKLKEEFFKVWTHPGSTLGSDLSELDRDAVEALARSTDFSMFEAPDLERILRLHSTTPYHALRFPVQLKPRPAVQQPPLDAALHEARYVEKLLDTYNEKYGLALQTLQEAREHERTKRHLVRQREAFYCAESLRVFARDSVPPETYEAVESDLYEAVVDVEERDYDSGYERLSAVLEAAGKHQPNPGNIPRPGYHRPRSQRPVSPSG